MVSPLDFKYILYVRVRECVERDALLNDRSSVTSYTSRMPMAPL